MRERKNQGTFSQVPILTPDEKLEDSLMSVQLDGLGVTWETATYYQRTVISSVTDEIVQLITADRKRVAVEARIDEWKAMGDFLTKVDKEILSREFLDLYRLHGERLKAEREAL